MKCKNSCKKTFLKFESNFGPKMFYLVIFGLEFQKIVVKFEIATVEQVEELSFVQKQKYR